MPKRKTLPARPEPDPRYRANKKRVRFSGQRWRLVKDRGKWLLIERKGRSMWVPGEATT